MAESAAKLVKRIEATVDLAVKSAVEELPRGNAVLPPEHVVRWGKAFDEAASQSWRECRRVVQDELNKMIAERDMQGELASLLAAQDASNESVEQSAQVWQARLEAKRAVVDELSARLADEEERTRALLQQVAAQQQELDRVVHDARLVESALQVPLQSTEQTQVVTWANKSDP